MNVKDGMITKNKKTKINKHKKVANYLWFLIFLGVFSLESSYAKNLGVWGAVFPIAERDIKEFIFDRLAVMQQNGEMEKLNKRFLDNVKKHTLRPTPVAGLTTTEQPKLFYYDPTYVLNKTIEDDKGNVIAKAGTTINPLDTINLHGVMFFLNADDKRQIKWALDNSKKHDYVRYILVQGNIKTASEVLADRVYFDQYGLITKQLGIKHIPCVVEQDGKKLKITESALQNGGDRDV